MQNAAKNKSYLIFIITAIILTVCSRFPFLLENINFNNDAAIYARNFENDFMDGNYDVQLPGYVSYIYLGRLINHFTADTTVTQHIINIILLLLITITAFNLFKAIKFTNKESLYLTILFSFNSILLLGSITGGNRLFLTLAALILIRLAIQIVTYKKKKMIIYFSIYFAFFIGFRQDLSFYFFPLYLYLFIKIKDIKLTLVSLLIFTLICITWFFPLLAEYGGLAAYINHTKNSHTVSDTSIIFSGFKLSPILNMFRIYVYLLKAFLFIIPILIFSLIKKEFTIKKQLLWILILSFFPALLFQMLVHNGNFVQLAAFMAPLFIFMTLNFKLTNSKRIIFISIIIALTLFQFFGTRMFKSDKIHLRTANVLWLQYTYDGAKTGRTLRLRELKDDMDMFKNDQ